MSTCRKHETRHIVAFLDLLGASKMIESDDSEAVLNKIAYLFKEIEEKWLYVEGAPKEIHNVKCVTFSDNIALALALTDELTELEVGEYVSGFITYVGIFQAAALRNGLLFRGGISIGALYVDSTSNLIWGKALVDAHILEDEEAIYPRVIFDDNIDMTKLPEKARVVKDADDRYYVDYLTKIKDKFPGWIEQAKLMVQKNLE